MDKEFGSTGRVTFAQIKQTIVDRGILIDWEGAGLDTQRMSEAIVESGSKVF